MRRAGFSGAAWSRLPLQQSVSDPSAAPCHPLVGACRFGRCSSRAPDLIYPFRLQAILELTTLMSLSNLTRLNITLGPKEERLLITGLHTVADIYCTCCNTVLGWKYVSSTPMTTFQLICLSKPRDVGLAIRRRRWRVQWSGCFVSLASP